MGLSKKQRDELAKRKENHDARPTPHTIAPIGFAAMQRMARDHQDVLESIEFAVVQAYRKDLFHNPDGGPEDVFDDETAMAALVVAALGEATTDGPRVNDALQRLHATRPWRADVADKIWSDGLRVVMDSVCTHSTRCPGDVAYLEFVRPYMP